MHKDCIFCKVIAGEIPATIVQRTDDVVAIEDVNPQAPAHLLVMPVEHVATLHDYANSASPEVVAKLFQTVAELGRERGGSEGFRLVVNTGPRGGQTVDHLHVHVLAGRQMHWPPG